MQKRVVRSFVPNLLTLGNLFCGFTAIIHISADDYFAAGIFILMAGIFDMLDGVAARFIGSTSDFGAELDSLSDAVSFGVAPGFMLYKVYFHQFGETGVLLSALPALAGVIRLARYNVKFVTSEDKKYFVGLPIPSSALTIVSYILFYHQQNLIPPDFKATGIIIVTLITSIAMVSEIKYDNTPRPTLKSIKQRPIVSALMFLGLIAAIASMGKLIFPIMMTYIIVSAIRHFFEWIKRTYEPEDEIDETGESEPEPFE